MNEPESSDQLRMMLFIILSLAVFLVTSYLYKPATQPQAPKETKEATSPGPEGANAAPATGNGGGASVAAGNAEKTAPVPAIGAAAEKTIAVESPVYRVELSNRGGVVQSWKLKKYFDEETPPRPLDLVDAKSSKQLGWPFSLKLADPQLEAEANAALYRVSVTEGKSGEPAPDTADAQAPAGVTFTWSDGRTEVIKKLEFGPSYEVSIEVSVKQEGKALPVAVAWRGEFGDKQVYKATQLLNVFYDQNDKLTTLAVKKLGVSGNQSQPAEQAGPLEFAGIMDQFFTASFLADDTNLSLWDWVNDASTTVDDKPAQEQVAEMAAGTAAPQALRMRAYIGPKELALLSKEKPSLEELVQFGWTGMIAKPLLYALQWVHKYIPNYGWAIVVFTFVLTMVLFPVRLWTFRSARKMQLVAPEIKAIQDRYKKYSMTDPRKRKMNEEVMAVYQREGINPMGSCLPMLVQLPIIWAFYRMLAGAIELRHAPWIWWIHDLSARDPYYILPIVLTVSMYLVTKMTPMPTTGDAAQQKMMTLMPLLTGFIFFYLSSGLNLYYFTSNLVNVGQQWYLNKTHPLPSRSKFKKSKE